MRPILLALLLVGCPATAPGPASPELPPLGPPSAYPATFEGACANLERLRCPEARPTRSGISCPRVLERAAELRDIHVACIASASDLVDLRACGGVRCVP